MATITQAAIDDFDSNGIVLGVDFVAATDGQTINAGDAITAEAKSGFEINSITQSGGYNPVTGTTDVYEFDVSGDKTTASWDYVDGVDLELFTFDVSTVEIEGLEITQAIIDNFETQNTTIGVDGVAVEIGDVIQTGDVVSLTPIEGYLIVNAGWTGEYDPISGTTPEYEFTVNEDGTEATITYDHDAPSFDGIAGANVTTIQAAEETQGTNNVYLVDYDILEAVNEQRFQLRFQDDNPTTVDYGEYILSLISLPTEIDPLLILEPENIVLGDFATTVQADVIATDAITIDMGIITVPRINEDLRDFYRTECVLHLPYSQPVAIDPEYVIGQTISVEYIVDAYSGEATINIFSTKVGEVFLTQKSTLGINIPYSITFNGSASAENSNIVIGGDNKINNPYMEIIRNEAVLFDGFFTIPIVDEDAIINHTGFIQVEEIELEISGSYSEKESVIAALQTGVIIK